MANLKSKIFPLIFAVLIFSFANTQNGFAQQRTKIRIIQSDQLLGNKTSGEDLNIFTGNVIFEHDSAYLYCDSAVLNNNSTELNAYKNVHIKVSDTLNLFGDELNYNGNTRISTMTGNVILKDNKATLYTNRLIYERNTRIAYYTTGGKILNDENELTSKRGYYYTDEKQVYFKNEVQLENPEYTLNSDTLIFNTASEIAYISGPTTIIGKDEFLYAEDGVYDTRSGKTQLASHPYMTYKEQYLRGDSIYFEKESGIGQVYGNAFLKDTAQNMIVTGNFVDYKRNAGYAYATDSAVVIMIDKADSLFMHADTLRLIFDSTDKPSVLLAYYKCRFYKKDFQGVSDSLVYSFSDSTIKMHFHPALWTQDNQLTAELIKIFSSEQSIDSMEMINSSFIISADKYGPDKYNQIKGKLMTAFFKDNALDLIKVNGNSETIYFFREESGAMIGVNKAVSSYMEIWLKDRQVQDIFYFDSPDAGLYPLNETSSDQLFLRDFKWRVSERPQNKFDIFRQTENQPALR